MVDCIGREPSTSGYDCYLGAVVVNCARDFVYDRRSYELPLRPVLGLNHPSFSFALTYNVCPLVSAAPNQSDILKSGMYEIPLQSAFKGLPRPITKPFDA